MTIPKELEAVLVTTPDILSGAVRFRGTRVPVQALLDTLDEGQGLTEFLDGWPDVSAEQAEAIVHWETDHARRVLGLELAAA